MVYLDLYRIQKLYHSIKIESKGAAIVATQSVYFAIEIALVLTRLYIRSKLIRNFEPDDVFILLDLVSITLKSRFL